MGVLIMLATILFAGALIASSILFLVVGKPSLLKYTVGCCLVWLAAYALALFGVSLSSSEQTLAFHEPKRFCGFYLDCHMATEVSTVRREKEYKGQTAIGGFWIVGIEVSSDARRAKLRIISPRFQVVDEGERRFDPVRLLSTPSMTLERRIGPDERIKGEIVFDLPESVKNPRLDVQMVDPIDVAFETILIGDEDSLFHKRTYFSLQNSDARAGF